MELTLDLSQIRKAVLKKWFDLIIATYPPESTRLLSNSKDQFANPIGYSISNGIEAIYDQLSTAMNPAELNSALDEVIRVRAVQDFTASQAVAFVFSLKTVIRDVLGERSDAQKPELTADLAEIDARIDKMAMLAFDVYMERREKFHEIRASEIKKSSIRLFERLNNRPYRIQNNGESIDDADRRS